jgi:hypothetical protein
LLEGSKTIVTRDGLIALRMLKSASVFGVTLVYVKYILDFGAYLQTCTSLVAHPSFGTLPSSHSQEDLGSVFCGRRIAGPHSIAKKETNASNKREEEVGNAALLGTRLIDQMESIFCCRRRDSRIATRRGFEI